MSESNYREIIEKVKQYNPIEDVMSEYTDLRGQGDRLVGSCPMPDHRDSNPSMMVDVHAQTCFCFGCGAKGDVVDIIRQVENLDFIRALELLGDRAGIEVDIKSDTFRSEKLKKTYEVMDKLNLLLNKILFIQEFKEGMDYLKNVRDIDEDVVKKFGIGYNPGWSNYKPTIAYFKNIKPESKAILKEIDFIADSKLIKHNISEYDTFSNRITLPIRDMKGNILGFTARTLIDKTKSGDEVPKYKNSKDSYLFDKSTALYGLYESLHIINDINKNRKVESIIVPEGGFDVLACLKNNIPACAPMGTALTEKQAKMLWRYTDQVVLCMDSDSAGQKATLKNIQVLLSTMPKGKNIKVASLTAAKDPDESIKNNGLGVFKDDIKNSQDVVDYVVNHFSRVTDKFNKQEIIDTCRDLSDYLSGIRNKLIVQSIKHFVCQKLEISNEMVEVREPMISKSFPSKKFKTNKANSDLLLSSSMSHIITLLHSKPILSKFIDLEALSKINNTQDKGFSYFKDIISIYIADHQTPPQVAINRYFGQDIYSELLETINKTSDFVNLPTASVSDMLNETLNKINQSNKTDKKIIYEITKKFEEAEPLSEKERLIWSDYMKNGHSNNDVIEFLTKPNNKKELENGNEEDRRREDGVVGFSNSR